MAVMLQKPRLILSIYLYIFVAGCIGSSGQTPDNIPIIGTEINRTDDISLLGNCTSPCWAGIQPRKTTGKESAQILITIYGQENISVGENSIEWINRKSNSRGSVILINNLVDLVYLWFPNKYVTVQTIIKEIGEPEFVNVSKSSSFGSDCLSASLFYSNKGMDVGLYMYETSVGVAKLQYVESILILSLDVAKARKMPNSFLLRWRGYENYCPKF